MELEQFHVEIYQNKQGKSPFIIWLESIKDLKAISKISIRIARVRLGNLGDYKSLGGGLYELRIDEGAGYRVYFVRPVKENIILLLIGGSKKTQTKDINKARQYLNDYVYNK
jgi:putative addiction module killer protein